MLVDKSSKSGFSSDLQPGQYTDYPVVISKKSLLEKIRHHVIRFQGQDVDPRNQKEFTRPLKLHRRDARAPLPGTKEYLEEQERRKDASFKAEIDPERAAAMAEIAPSASKPRKPMKQNKKKIMGFVKRDETEGKTTESMIRYEEAMPWQLEDFDNKQIWGGVYEAALSETWAQLEFQGDKFVVTPVEKWYKFQPRTRIDPEKLKQIQEQNRARTKREESDEPNWIKKLGDKNARDAEEEKMDRKARGLYSAKGVDEGDTAGFAGGGEDGDEIDFEEDFADDEAPPAIEGEEEDIKHVEQRVKRDMLKANVFAIKEETDYDKEELQERLLREQEKRFGKTLRKALVKREKNLKYESNSDNPYSSSVRAEGTLSVLLLTASQSESIDTEAEEERKRQEEAEKAEADKSSPEKGKKDPPSATNTKGTNTPSHRAEKRNPSNSLKRPGSPNLSDVSGNESARKKQKMKPTIGTSKLGTGVNTPNGPPSRPRSPAVPINGNAAPPRLAGAGSGSDTDAGSAGEHKRRLLKLNSPRGGSPSTSQMPSRAGSPTPAAPTSSKGTHKASPLPLTAQSPRLLSVRK